MKIDAVTFLAGLFRENAADVLRLPAADPAIPAVAEPTDRTTGGGIGPDDLPEPWRELYEERAAIREYCGGQLREHAEAEALAEVLAMMHAATADAAADPVEPDPTPRLTEPDGMNRDGTCRIGKGLPAAVAWQVERLRQLATACEVLNPALAARHRAEANRLEKL